MDTEIVKGTEIGAAVRGTGHAERGGGIGKENIGATKKDRLADITKKRGNIGALVKTTSTALVDATEKMAPHPLAGEVDDANGREAQIGAHRRLKDAQHSRNGSEICHYFSVKQSINKTFCINTYTLIFIVFSARKLLQRFNIVLNNNLSIKCFYDSIVLKNSDMLKYYLSFVKNEEFLLELLSTRSPKEFLDFKHICDNKYLRIIIFLHINLSYIFWCLSNVSCINPIFLHKYVINTPIKDNIENSKNITKETSAVKAPINKNNEI